MWDSNSRPIYIFCDLKIFYKALIKQRTHLFLSANILCYYSKKMDKIKYKQTRILMLETMK